MKEIGGYIELDTYDLSMMHNGAIPLNCGRNALAYLFKSRGIKKIKLPFLICGSIIGVCEREGVEKSFYHIDYDFKPNDDIFIANDEWLYIINYYGQLSYEDLNYYAQKYKRVIIDQANAYFEKPIAGFDTIYTCRKWFGVPDGALLYTDSVFPEALSQDESFDRMRFLLGRYERSANEFYSDYVENNKRFEQEPVKLMSKLTMNLLHGIDYDSVLKKRIENFRYLDEHLSKINRLTVINAAFMYPFLIENGTELRKKLQEDKIYIPTLWPAVFDITAPDDKEYEMAANILPLPVDQRYGFEEMSTIVESIKHHIC